jgi:LmbE family N-acetylglucosaminyl deacetylase
LSAPDAGLGKIERAFLFSTDRDPNVFVDLTPVYETKLAACMAHRSQFPKGEESLGWMKEMDGRQGEVVGATYAEGFKQINVW